MYDKSILETTVAMPAMPDKCPACGSPISMGSGDNPGWSCSNRGPSKCNAFSFKGNYEHPEITRGRRMHDEYENIPAMDKKITRLPGRVQLGILRERHRKCLENEQMCANTED